MAHRTTDRARISPRKASTRSRNTPSRIGGSVQATEPPPDLDVETKRLAALTAALDNEGNELAPIPLSHVLAALGCYGSEASTTWKNNATELRSVTDVIGRAASSARKLAASEEALRTRTRDANRSISEAEGYISGARTDLDDVWHALEDACAPDGKRTFTVASNLETGRRAIYELLQSIRAAEANLLDAARKLCGTYDRIQTEKRGGGRVEVTP